MVIEAKDIVSAVEQLLDGTLAKSQCGNVVLEYAKAAGRVELSRGAAAILCTGFRSLEVDLKAATMFRPLCSCEETTKRGNATFHCFKDSGKWYASERGNLPESVFKAFDRSTRRRLILEANGGKYPGLSGTGNDMTFVVFADDSVDYGFPLMLYPDDFSHRTPPADFP